MALPTKLSSTCDSLRSSSYPLGKFGGSRERSSGGTILSLNEEAYPDVCSKLAVFFGEGESADGKLKITSVSPGNYKLVAVQSFTGPSEQFVTVNWR
jgi:hypothetical protein